MVVELGQALYESFQSRHRGDVSQKHNSDSLRDTFQWNSEKDVSIQP